MKPKCRSCKNASLRQLIDFGTKPVVHNLLHSPDEEFETYPFVLATCDICGLLQLEHGFPSDIFYKEYVTLSSWKLQPHAKYLIEVIERFMGCLRDRRFLEIGCNDGAFLDLISAAVGVDQITSDSIVAFEPSKDAWSVCVGKGYNVKNEFFSAQVVDDYDLANEFDFIISRQVFEHIEDPSDFLCGVRLALRQNGVLVLEVPNFRQNLDNFDYTLWEEHVSYFTPHSLEELLGRNGFRVFHSEVTLFAGSALTVFAQKAPLERVIKPMSEFANAFEQRIVQRYAESYHLFKKKFLDFVGERAGPELLIYGCGARSSFFANIFFPEVDIKFVDDRFEKVGKIVPGCMAPIFSWNKDFSSKYILLGVNSEAEYAVIRKRGLGSGAFCSILPPSLNLPDFWRNFQGAS